MAAVQVGIGILARHPETGSVLLGKRTVKHGSETYSFPGGHLEFGESFVECARRELKEETNLEFDGEVVAIATLNNIFHDAKKHYVTILSVIPATDVEQLVNAEPEKCAGWDWVAEEQIREWINTGERSLFLPIINYYGGE
ncbi:Putative uncharacterized protein [Taphrina deformans PYCC 5710]|uniref:Nudix hydrolase domain-containing protein n=1 Tax=Taphrina deformans (strain PYCC 5710 / ATCC 11124 / CBS 356.35 / IMI 108563 / JCM 9778 / NBRC 8474) TaxID=1097556 RepID=R4XDH1_TAPDE|nr:Putative uncharacterized protein [Taphrina deformans PYCC 5710]|eukprot:CCG81394.1 Putative uncharacterized protein [Taphrina deformans PYCC 5710]